jgi:hypothetical protein
MEKIEKFSFEKFESLLNYIVDLAEKEEWDSSELYTFFIMYTLFLTEQYFEQTNKDCLAVCTSDYLLEINKTSTGIESPIDGVYH